MGKVKIKRSDVWIDMTPMSDVMVLLLTFFMLTSTFVKNEPVKVVTPGSVSELKVPETDVLTILVDEKGKVFMGMDKTSDLENALDQVIADNGIDLTAAQKQNFKNDAMFGAPLKDLKSYLSLSISEMSSKLGTMGIPTDSIQGSDGRKGMSEFQQWVNAARTANDNIQICIKAGSKAPYKIVKDVMSELQDMNENRYYLVTSYKNQED